jgi:hypothetical protein
VNQRRRAANLSLHAPAARGRRSEEGRSFARRRGLSGAPAGLGMTGSGYRDARLPHSAAGCGLPIASCRRLALLRAARPGRGGQALWMKAQLSVGGCPLPVAGCPRHTAGGQALSVPRAWSCSVLRVLGDLGGEVVWGLLGSLASFQVLLGPPPGRILRKIPRIIGPNGTHAFQRTSIMHVVRAGFPWSSRR